MSEARKLIIPRPINRTAPVIELDPSTTEGLYRTALQIAKEREALLNSSKWHTSTETRRTSTA